MIIKIGNVELTEEEAYRLYTERKYIVTYSRIYQLHFSENLKGNIYGTEIYYCKGMARRGRYFAMDANTVNNLLGFELVS